MAGRGDAAHAWPTEPGSYLLLLRLERDERLTIGRLGTFDVAQGWHLYVGSALGGLRGRLARHLRADKRRHWHIDYLAEVAPIVAVGAACSPERIECRWAERLAVCEGAKRWPPRFGASDCGCAGHLIHLPKRPALEELMPFLAGDAPWLARWLIEPQGE